MLHEKSWCWSWPWEKSCLQVVTFRSLFAGGDEAGRGTVLAESDADSDDDDDEDNDDDDDVGDDNAEDKEAEAVRYLGTFIYRKIASF